MAEAEKVMEELCGKTVVIVLAGGRGERLLSLTEHRAKPAVTFGGKYRIIDFVLSNCVNSGLSKILVTVQYKFDSLVRHLNLGWNIFTPEKGEYLRILPPQMRVSNGWYQGTADAVYQNIYSLRADQPRYVLILSGDQIYRMDYRELLWFHRKKKADLTIAAVESDREIAQRSGVLEIDEEFRVIGFEEKPAEPKSLPNQPDRFLVSMGDYVFNSRELIEGLETDMADENSVHDFSRSIIPKMFRGGKNIFVFPFKNNKTGETGYWRDVGTIEDFFRTNMDLVGIKPRFNLYDRDWPWRVFQKQFPPAKIVFSERVKQSIISEGCIVDEGEIIRSILSPGVKVGKNTQVIDSIVMDEVVIEDGARIIRAIIDKENIIPAGSVVEAGNMKYEGKHEIVPSESGEIVLLPRHFVEWRGED